MAIADLMEKSGVVFGTSGARGLAQCMTDRVCYAYTTAFLQHLEKQSLIRPGDEVLVAGDFRPSTPRIMAACFRAVQDMGYRAVNGGAVPSPAVANLGLRRGIASLMVTGSHIPDDRNGIKFNRPDGEILKPDEAAIREQSVMLPGNLFDDSGMAQDPFALPSVDSAVQRAYVSRYLDYLPPDALSGARVLLYEHSSVASEVLGQILEGLGARVEPIGHSETFVPVDTEAVRSEDVALGRQWAAERQFDIIVSTDGDGDRPLIGDERGEWLRGDVLGVLTAHYLQADAVVTPVSSNTVLERSGWFERTLRTRIGSPFVIEGMRQLAEEGAANVVGYEANGGFLTWHDIERHGRTLPALPTRDAVIVALAVLMLARRQGQSLSELVASLPSRHTASDRLKAFPSQLSQAKIAALAEGGSAMIEETFASLALGPLEAVDRTDGLRLTFANGEIVHLRASGNAPELRCYNEANSADRAAALNRACMILLERWRETGKVAGPGPEVTS
ncbi:MAG: phosphomannomutase [Gammaproteobacteria bacterium]|nr:MAG: phosphomannomutase [Gammaproteobacteria bacterium]